MALSILGRVRSRRILCLSAFVALILAAGSSSSEAGYLYQSRPTQHSPNAARFRHVSVRLGDGRVGVFGGFGRVDVELFEPVTEQFVTSRASRGLVDFAAAALLSGDVLLVDGAHDCVFDYLTEQYLDTQNAYPGGAVRFPVLVPLPDGKVFISGGQDGNSRPQSVCAMFDPRTLQFQTVGDLAVPRVFHRAVLIDNRHVLIAGGYGYRDGQSELAALDSLELFDIYAGRSGRIRTGLQQARYDHCSVRTPDGRVLILGGTHSGTEYWLRSTEIFDPSTSTLRAGPDLGLGRSGAKTTVLPSGRIAVFGGNHDARTIEIYCPETGTFALADSLMVDPRWSDFTATGLESGVVLLVGGRIDGGPEVVQNAEIFEEIATDAPSAPAVTEASIRGLLADRNLNVVNEAVEWLVGLGPQVKPILQTLAQDESPDLARRATSIIQSIDERDYPVVWCVEVWDASGRLDTVWLDSFECPDTYSPGFPSPLFTSVLRATEGVDLTHLVVRFPTHAPYESRVQLFNLVGWTRIPKVVLGEGLSEDELARAVGPVVR
jgi:hypothetical protein